MNANIQYITQFTKEDIRQIAEVANIECKDGIKMKREQGKVVLSIDIDQLRGLLNPFGTAE